MAAAEDTDARRAALDSGGLDEIPPSPRHMRVVLLEACIVSFPDDDKGRQHWVDVSFTTAPVALSYISFYNFYCAHTWADEGSGAPYLCVILRMQALPSPSATRRYVRRATRCHSCT